MKLDTNDRKEIESYLSQDLDTLLSILSLSESSKNEYMKFLPGQELDHGVQIFESLKDSLYHKICIEWDFCNKRHDPDLNDSTFLVAAVMDTISTLTLGFPTTILIATILVKKGLSKFCKCKTISK